MSVQLEDEAYCKAFEQEIVMSEKCNCQSCWMYTPTDTKIDNYICIYAQAESTK